MDLKTQGTRLHNLLGLRAAPVAMAFRPSPPLNIGRIGEAGPAGCAYWRLAAEGRVFYTQSSDHYNCPIGAHTHGVDLPPAKAAELEDLVHTMVALEYIRTEEVATLPRRNKEFEVAIYSPLADAPCDPDVVLVRGNAKQMMLLAEAASAAGVEHDGALMGRPTCAVVPEAIRSQQVVTSLGCIGNRVYTELADDELYCAIPGPKLPTLVDKLVVIIRANQELEGFHLARKGTTSPGAT